MQVVILAAGRGTRMGALTESCPKPMLMVGGKTLLEHKFDALPPEVTEIIIVVGYLSNVITGKYGDAYNGIKITYVTQENMVGGTADALWQARPHLKNTFLVMMGDDIYHTQDIDAVRGFEWALLTEKVPDTSIGGAVMCTSDNHIIDIIEGSQKGEGKVSTNLFALDVRLFDFPQIPKAPGSTEMGLPQTVLAASQASGIPFIAVDATQWIQISNPDDIARAEHILEGKK